MVLLSSMTSTRMPGGCASPSLLTEFSRSAVRSWRLGPPQICTISKSSLRAPHSGQVQFIGTSSHFVPGAMPCSGSPAASSYIHPQMRHIQVRDSVTLIVRVHYNGAANCSHLKQQKAKGLSPDTQHCSQFS